MTDSERDTREHIEKVQKNLAAVRDNLNRRAIAHDLSKLREPELSGYESLHNAMQGVQYATPEYKAVLAAHEGVIKHHCVCNSHHPEHWHLGVTDMSLLDIMEMLADWKAAFDRKGGDFGHSIQTSVSRFGISTQLHAVLINTAKELGWL